MLFSIAISTYEANGNGHIYLKTNLDKIKDQTFKDIEVVISDHSKNDEIKKLCMIYSSFFNIKYIKYSQDYGSSSSNTNNAINKCNGELVKILFMDDYLENENSLQIIVDEFKKNPDKKWLVNSYYHKQNNLYNSIFHPSWNNYILFANTIGCPSAVTIKKEIKTRFDNNLVWFMDCDFYHRIVLEYGLPLFLHNPIIVNQLHSDQVTNKITTEIINKERKYLIKSRNIKKIFLDEFQKYWYNKKILNDNNLELLN